MERFCKPWREALKLQVECKAWVSIWSALQPVWFLVSLLLAGPGTMLRSRVLCSLFRERSTLPEVFFNQHFIRADRVEWQYGDNNMTLIEVIRDLEKQEVEATIYVAEPWAGESQAVVAFEPEEGGVPAEAENLSYFLEVFVARDFLEDWEPTLESPPTLQERCARLVQYAINDA